MPKWTGTTTGGTWFGGGTFTPDCTQTQQNAITNAFNAFIGDACLDCFPGLKACLSGNWGGIEIDCTDPACAGLDGQWNGSRILMCNTSATRVGPVLLHEMVHACGGTELDSEAVEHACFNGNGATLPTGPDSSASSDWSMFRSATSMLDGNIKERVGKFVIWNSDTGEVWARSEQGGGWFGGAKTVKGTSCFQSAGWVHAYP